MISGTITDLSGRTLSGQTPAAFCTRCVTQKPLTIGLNCALGAREMRAHLAELSRIADTLVCRLSQCGPAERVGLMTRAPNIWLHYRRVRGGGLINIIGGCCGTTPAHIRAIAERVKGVAPGRYRNIAPLLRLSGLEPFVLNNEIPFVNVGERTNVTGSAKFRKLIKDGDFSAALDVARDQVAAGAQIIDVNMDEGLLDSQKAMVNF